MTLLAILSNLAGPDLVIILLIILVLFGSKKLPELARGMGQALREFQKAKDEIADELHQSGKGEVTDSRAVPATAPRIENAPPSVCSPRPIPGTPADRV